MLGRKETKKGTKMAAALERELLRLLYSSVTVGNF